MPDASYRVQLDVFVATSASRVDIDNVAKVALDACNGVVWKDDRQVEKLVIERHVNASAPGLVVSVEMRVTLP